MNECGVAGELRLPAREPPGAFLPHHFRATLAQKLLPGRPWDPRGHAGPRTGASAPGLQAEAGATPSCPRPSCPSSFLLSSGSANLALEPGIFQKADLRVAQGTRPQTGRVGRVRAGPGPPPCSHPQRALTQMLRRAAGSPHPGITPATSLPGPRGAREGSRLRGRSDSEVGTGRTGFVHD